MNNHQFSSPSAAPLVFCRCSGDVLARLVVTLACRRPTRPGSILVDHRDESRSTARCVEPRPTGFMQTQLDLIKIMQWRAASSRT